MSLHPRGPGKWIVSIGIGSKPRGTYRQVSKTFTARTATEAKRMAPAIEADLRAKHLGEATKGSFQELVNDWKATKWPTLSPTTTRGYKTRVERIEARFGAVRPEKVTAREIETWYATLRSQDVSASEINKTHAVLSGILSYGYRLGELPEVATKRVQIGQHIPDEHVPPTDQVVELLMGSATGEPGNAFKCAAFLGLRRGEIVGLQWADISDTEVHVRRSVVSKRGGGVIVKTPKGKRERWVILTPQARDALADQRRIVEASPHKGKVSPWVFPSWERFPLLEPRAPDWVSHQWAAHRATVGAEDVRLHGLRHWCATYLLRRGVPMATVSAMLGHAQESTTRNIYSHAVDADRALVLGAFSSWGEPKPAIEAESPGT